jgi:hypothetical protein
LIFSPFAPLERDVDYNINISAEASNTEGLSLDTAFDRNFTTKPNKERLILVSYYPSMYEEIDDQRAEVRLEFSAPIKLNALYDNVSFSPSMSGSWKLEDGEKLAVFTPSEPWILNRRHEIRLASSLTGSDFISVFITGTDHEEPVLLSANRIGKDGNKTALERDVSGFVGVTAENENTGWEKDDRLALLFSKPVDALSVKNYLSVEGASSLAPDSKAGSETEIVFYFETIPAYESRFTFRLKAGVKDNYGNESKEEYIYRIFADGAYSKPPALAGIRMPMSPAGVTDFDLKSFAADSLFEIIPITDNNYPSGENIKTWIELYFTTAKDAIIDLFSLMELFRIETGNNALAFSPRLIKTENFSVTEPYKDWEDLQRVEISGYLINSTNFGIVNFQISAGLKDSLNNKNEKLQRISTIK